MTASHAFARSRLLAASVAAGALALVAQPSFGDETYQPVFGPAIDWSILARISESLTLSTNRQLDGVSDDLEAQDTVSVGLTVAGVGKRTQFSLATGFAAGRATDGDANNLDRFDPNLSATAVFLRKGYSVNVSASGRTRPTSVSELEEDGDGDTITDTTRIDASASVGVSWQPTKRDSMSVGTSVQIVDFSRTVGTLTPSRSVSVSASWSREVTRTTSLSLSSSVRQFDAEGANGSDSRSANIQFGIRHERTSRHSLGGSAGISLVSTEQQNGGTSTQMGFVGSGSFSYTGAEITANLSLNQSIRPSSDGDLNAFTSLGGSLGYSINQLENLSFGLSYSRRSDISGGGDVLQVLSLGPSYSYSLTQNSSLSLRYQFRVRDDETNGFETGHQLMLTLSHGLTLLD